MNSPLKMLLRSLSISVGAWLILPDDGPYFWLIVSNEVLKIYRYHKETQDMIAEFEAQHKRWEAEMKSRYSK